MLEAVLPSHLVADKVSTRNNILLNAIHLLSEYSYSDVSLDRIAKTCNIKKQSILHYFPSKKALVLASLDLMLRHHQAVLATLAQQPSYEAFLASMHNLLLNEVDGRFVASLAANSLQAYPSFSEPLQRIMGLWENALSQYLAANTTNQSARNILNQIFGLFVMNNIYATDAYSKELTLEAPAEQELAA